MSDDPIQRWDGPEDSTANVQLPFLDEFIARGVDVHYEAMGDNQFWIGIHDPATGRHWSLNLGALNPRAKGYAIVEEDG